MKVSSGDTHKHLQKPKLSVILSQRTKRDHSHNFKQVLNHIHCHSKANTSYNDNNQVCDIATGSDKYYMVVLLDLCFRNNLSR